MFQQISQKIKAEKSEHELIPRIHHILMKEYGWIPLNEFKGEVKESKISFEFPIVLTKRRLGWKGRLKDILYGCEQKIEKIMCNGTITSNKEGFPIPTTFSLMEQIRQDREEEKKQIEQSKKGRK